MNIFERMSEAEERWYAAVFLIGRPSDGQEPDCAPLAKLLLSGEQPSNVKQRLKLISKQRSILTR
ncbi:MAG: hypothetical protein ACKVON_08745 [Beijerinckiaceae bacterium]